MLSRAIRRGEQITLTVVAIRDDKVRIGIECEKDIPVHREEIFEAIMAENGKDVQDT
jgi:carbon storage regulator